MRARTIEVAQQRQDLHPEDTSVRVLDESTIRSLKRAFPNSKLPVRGLSRSRMIIYPGAVMVNVRRLHHYYQSASQELSLSLSSVKNVVCRRLKRIYRHLSRHLHLGTLRPAAVSLGRFFQGSQA